MSSEVVFHATLPRAWRLGAHGDPIAVFNQPAPVLQLHADGTVTWQFFADGEPLGTQPEDEYVEGDGDPSTEGEQT